MCSTNNPSDTPRIVFINPFHREWAQVLPLGIAYLAAVAQQQGWKVSVIDASAQKWGADQAAQEAMRLTPDVLAVSASTAQINEAWRIIDAVKRLRPTTLTMLGGVHPTALPEESLEKKSVDLVCIGEGEETLRELLDTLRTSRDFSRIRGIAYRQGETVVTTPARPLIDNLDSLPLPARELFPFPQAYKSPYMLTRRYATLITSRGCPGACLFCNKKTFGFGFRARSARAVVEEMETLQRTFDIGEFHISDDCFSWDEERVEEICTLILKKKLRFSWACSNGIRVDRGNRELFALMRRSGCYRVAFGVESGDPMILERLGKKIDLGQVNRAFRAAQEAGIITVALFMLGNCGESAASMERTIAFAKTLTTDYAQFAIAVPYPGTALFETVERRGKFLTRDWERFGIFGEPVVFEMDQVTRALLLSMYRKAYREFYFRPGQVAFILKKRAALGHWGDLPQLISAFFKVVTRALPGRGKS